MNGLVRLSYVMGDVAGVNGNANVSALTPVYLRAIEEVSRQLWKETDTQFFAQTATRYYSGDNSRLFMLGDSLVSVTSLKTSTTVYQPTTFDKTLVANTDYTLWPRNAANDSKPYRAILFNPNGQYSVAPYGFDNIQIIGVFGYSFETEDTLQMVADNPLLIGATTLTVESTADIDPGETLVIEDEQIYVASVNDPTTLTVTRAINGTTAAAHAPNTIVYRRRYPRDVEEAVKERVVSKRWDTQGGYSGAAALMGEDTPSGQSRASFARWMTVINDYRDPQGLV